MSTYPPCPGITRPDTRAPPPTQGLIYDAAGVFLADNRPSLSLEITLEEVEDPNTTIAKLGTLTDIGANDLKHFARMRKLRRRFEEIPIRSNLNLEEVARFAVNSHRFPRVAIRARLLRAYPLGEHTAHVLSYVGRINKQELKRIDTANYTGTNYIGKGGVERAYEDRLHGSRRAPTGRSERQGACAEGAGTAPAAGRGRLGAISEHATEAGCIRRPG